MSRAVPVERTLDVRGDRIFVLTCPKCGSRASASRAQVKSTRKIECSCGFTALLEGELGAYRAIENLWKEGAKRRK